MRTTLSLQAWTVGWQVVQERDLEKTWVWRAGEQVTDHEEPVDSLEECPVGTCVWESGTQ